MQNRHHSRRNRAQFGTPAPRRSCSFVWSKRGRVLGAVGPVLPSASRDAVQQVFDQLSGQFGDGVARIVCNSICFPPFRLPPLYAVGTLERLSRLHGILNAHGRFVVGSGFHAVADEPALKGGDV